MAGSKVSHIKTFWISNEDKPANRYKRTCQVPYPSVFLADLQKDSDDEGVMESGLRVELPFQEGSNFKKFLKYSTEILYLLWRSKEYSAVLKRTRYF